MGAASERQLRETTSLCSSVTMEIDQELLESLPVEQRRKLVKRMRQDQIKRYYEKEKAAKEKGTDSAKPDSKRDSRKVQFDGVYRLQDAVANLDEKEGMTTALDHGMFVYRIRLCTHYLLFLCPSSFSSSQRRRRFQYSDWEWKNSSPHGNELLVFW